MKPLLPWLDYLPKLLRFKLGQQEGFLRTQCDGRLAKVNVALMLVVLAFGAHLGLGVFEAEEADHLVSLSSESPVLRSFLRDEPFRIKANIPAIELASSSEFGLISLRMDPSNMERKLSASQCLHLIAAFGVDAKFADSQFSDGKAILEALTDSKQATKYFGYPTILPTRFGAQPVSGKEFGLASQAHRDQLLCCLAQQGLTPNFPLVVEKNRLSLYDVFSDSIANFHLGQEELAFTAIAYALYLPPNKQWMNKFGEQYAFDDLVEELLQRKLTGSHCCGTHLVEAMITLYRIDGEYSPILSKLTRTRLRERLQVIVGAILQLQAPDGSWGPQWSHNLDIQNANYLTPDDSRTNSRLLATGHILQLLVHLPPEFYPADNSVFAQAITWLNYFTADVDRDYIAKNFCPCSHAAWCLSRFRRMSHISFPSDSNSIDSVNIESVF